MNAILINLSLHEPVLISVTGGGDPNTNLGLNYIPGSSLRGAILQLYRQKFPASTNNVEDDFLDLFLRSKVHYLNAYPVTQDGTRCCPVPLSWFSPKNDPAEIVDLALNDEFDPTDTWQASGLQGEFFAPQTGDDDISDGFFRVTTEKTEMEANIHILRGDRQQTTKDGTVFRYVPISPDQTLQAVILSEDISLLNRIKELTDNKEAFIGKSHTANYGRVRMQLAHKNKSTPTQWMEYKNESDSDNLVITLLSDTILRDPHSGAFTLDLGGYFKSLHPAVSVERIFSRTRVISGFNRTWGLPSPQIQALMAGSVVVCRHDQDFLNFLENIQQNGIGERRQEGFGRFAINLISSGQIKIDNPPKKMPGEVQLAPESSEMALRISRSILRQKLDTLLFAAIHTRKIQNAPSNSQLSRLGENLKKIQHELQVNKKEVEARLILKEKMRAYLGDLKPLGKNQFATARYEKNTSMLDWMQEMFNNPEKIWAELGAQDVFAPAVGMHKAEKNDIAVEYLIRFMDGIIRLARKES